MHGQNHIKFVGKMSYIQKRTLLSRILNEKFYIFKQQLIPIRAPKPHPLKFIALLSLCLLLDVSRNDISKLRH
jgi:DNA-binding Xre family transcriptional regulator